MAWRIEIDDKAKKDLASLDKTQAKRITAFLRERVAALDDPRSIGEPLKGSSLGTFWKYRVGDYRIIASIEDGTLRVLVVKAKTRKRTRKRTVTFLNNIFNQIFIRDYFYHSKRTDRHISAQLF